MLLDMLQPLTFIQLSKDMCLNVVSYGYNCTI